MFVDDERDGRWEYLSHFNVPVREQLIYSCSVRPRRGKQIVSPLVVQVDGQTEQNLPRQCYLRRVSTLCP
eukprot:1172633-Rhodomonas_salina.1